MTQGVMADRETAVIDIGSNSVRLVLFRIEGRALWPVFNEKTMAGLGRGASQTGRLNPDGVESAMRALKRFAILLDAKKVERCHAVATAAVRDCADGPEFAERVKRETGLSIEVLSGEEEGRRSALGVLAGLDGANGIVGDLGGSSVEFARLSGNTAGRSISLALGPLAMGAGDESPETVGPRIEPILATAKGMLEAPGEVFYAVGGAWRAIAYLDMALNNYPLKLLHQYELSADRLMRTCAFAIGQSESSLASIPGVNARRAGTLPYAAELLTKIFKLGQFKSIVFSAHGLREGVLCAHDLALLSRGHPLIAGAEALARMTGPDPAFGRAIDGFLAPVFEQEKPIFGAQRDVILRHAAARLADLGARMHPDHRAELSLMETLYAPFVGVTHKERAFLALAMHHRYAGKKSLGEKHIVRRLLDENEVVGALSLGLALRLAAALSGRSARVLNAFELLREDEDLVLMPNGAMDEQLIVERAQTRFSQLANAMGLNPRLK